MRRSPGAPRAQTSRSRSPLSPSTHPPSRFESGSGRYRGLGARAALPPDRPRPSGRRSLEGRADRRPLQRRRRPLGARLLHRWRRGRHPQPRDGHARGAREHRARSEPHEVAESARIIGYSELVMLGYRDSGMPDSEANNDPRCFAKADFDEAVGRLVAVLRRERPQVIITYGDEQTRLSASRPPARARHLAAGVRASGRSRVVSRGGRAVAAAEDVLHDLVAGPNGSRAQQDARARSRVALRREVVRAAVARRSHHDPHRSRPVAVGAPRCACSRTRRRSTRRRRSGSVSPTRCLPSCTRGKTGCSRGASSAHLPKVRSSTISSPAVRSEARESA